MLVDIVADGGNLLLITNLTPTGKLDPLMAARLKEVGQWMKVNGQAIYATRRWVQYSQGNNIRFTQSKDSKYVYAFCYDWPDKELVLRDVKAEEGSSIQMLGASETLKWKQGESGLVIDIPESLSKNRPCDHIWVLKIPVSPSVAIGSTSTYFTKGSYSEVELESCGDIDEIRYTIDGSDPDRNSSMYTEPIKISSECTLIAQGFYDGKPNGDKATADFKLCVNVPAVKPQVYLEELDPVKINRGWSIGGKSWKKLSCTGGDLKISDKVYENGIGLHADAEVQFKIKPEYDRFVAQIGLDDGGKKGSVRVRIYADETLLTETPILTYGQKLWNVDIEIPTGVSGNRPERLRIVVDKATNGIDQDHTNIVNAGFVLYP
jgi:hypothetical protein